MNKINKLILSILSSFLLFSCGTSETSSSEESSIEESILSSEEVSSIEDSSIEEISSSQEDESTSIEVKKQQNLFWCFK